MEELQRKFIQDFIVDNRWHYITDGLKTTFTVTIFAVIFGCIIGIIIASIRSLYEMRKEHLSRTHTLSATILKILNAICKLYITVIRGTPTLVQLLIMYFIILVSMKSKVVVAVLTFSINSGAYVAEIFRGGILAVDKGQNEAGRSLGLSQIETMRLIILPQAFKNVLPSLINELVTLLKETSICGYIGLNELTRGGDIIRGTTYDAFLPLIGVACIYLIIVLGIQAFAAQLERRLRISDNR